MRLPGEAAPLRAYPLLVAVVAVGGAIGSLARYLVSLSLPTPDGGWPTATLVVNLAGALILGLLLEDQALRGADHGRRRLVRLFAGAGFCGGLTTYSTLALEIDLLAAGDHVGLAAAYAVVSVVGGLLATAGGIWLAVAVRRR